MNVNSISSMSMKAYSEKSTNPSFSGVKNLPGLPIIGTQTSDLSDAYYSAYCTNMVGHDTLTLNSKDGKPEKINVGITERGGIEENVDAYGGYEPEISIVDHNNQSIATLEYSFPDPEEPRINVDSINKGNSTVKAPMGQAAKLLLSAIAQIAAKSGCQINVKEDPHLLKEVGLEKDPKTDYWKVSDKLKEKFKKEPVIDMNSFYSFTPEN